MSEQNYLYTVTGLGEPFYAVVDASTGQAWTSPTKDGAIRQARDAGLDDFVEKTITREMFLRSLGIDVDPRMRAHRETPASPPRAESKPAEPPSSGVWFVPPAGTDAGSPFATGQRSESDKPLKQWSSIPPKSATPFAANAPIPMPGEEVIAQPDDVLIVPSSQKSTRRKNPFTDKPAAIPDDPAE